jgi:hypothetical protein
MGIISQANEGVKPGKQFFLTDLMKSISYQFLLKLTEGKTSVGLEQKTRFSMGLDSIPKNKFCLGGKQVVHPKKRKERRNQ